MFDPQPRHTKVVKNGSSSSLANARQRGECYETWLVNPVSAGNVTGRGIISCVYGMLSQCGSTISVSRRYRLDIA